MKDEDLSNVIRGMSTMVAMLAPEDKAKRGLFAIACVHAGIAELVESKTMSHDLLRTMLLEQLELSIKAATPAQPGDATTSQASRPQ